MNAPRSIDEIMNAMNERAKAQGRCLERVFWEIPSQPGSILDVQETPESRERIAHLRARRLDRKRAAEQSSGLMEGLQVEEQKNLYEQEEDVVQ